jgi:hypothetical protein
MAYLDETAGRRRWLVMTQAPPLAPAQRLAPEESLDDPQGSQAARSDEPSAALTRGAVPLAGEVLLAILPGALTAYLGLRDGGFFPGTAALVATEVGLCLALLLVLVRRPWAGISVPFLAAAAALAGLAAWTLASSDWSGAPARAMLE